MTTPSSATHSAPVNPLLEKARTAGNETKTGQDAEATGFDELLTREMSNQPKSSAGQGTKKSQDEVPEDMPEAANGEIPELGMKSGKDGRVTEKGSEEDLHSKIDVLVQQFMQAANPPSQLVERQPSLAVTGDTKATGVAFVGDGRAVKNKEREVGNGEHGLPVDPSELPDAMPGMSPGVAEQAASARPGIDGDTVDGGARTKSDVNALRNGTPQGSQRHAEFAPELASRGYVDKHVERTGESVSVIGTQHSLVTPGGILPSPDGAGSGPLQTVVRADPSLLLHPRIDSSAWGDALSQKVLWMVSQQQQTAELSLNPPDLGPLQVVLSVDNDQASATFVSQNPDVRQALEAALPRLKEMMAESGISLGSTTVSAEGSHPDGWQDRPGNGSTSSNPASSESVTESSTISIGSAKPIKTRGLVDTFA